MITSLNLFQVKSRIELSWKEWYGKWPNSLGFSLGAIVLTYCRQRSVIIQEIEEQEIKRFKPGIIQTHPSNHTQAPIKPPHPSSLTSPLPWQFSTLFNLDRNVRCWGTLIRKWTSSNRARELHRYAQHPSSNNLRTPNQKKTNKQISFVCKRELI